MTLLIALYVIIVSLLIVFLFYKGDTFRWLYVVYGAIGVVMLVLLVCSAFLVGRYCGVTSREAKVGSIMYVHVIPCHHQKHFTAKSCHRQIHHYCPVVLLTVDVHHYSHVVLLTVSLQRYCHVVLLTVGLHHYSPDTSQLYETLLSHRANNRFTISFILSH